MVSFERHIFRNYLKNNRNRRKPAPFEITFEEFRELLSQPCYICGGGPSNRYRGDSRGAPDLLYNGIDRVINSLGYVPGNVKACCHRCNSIKSELSLEALKGHLERMLRGLRRLRLRRNT